MLKGRSLTKEFPIKGKLEPSTSAIDSLLIKMNEISDGFLKFVEYTRVVQRGAIRSLTKRRGNLSLRLGLR